MIEEAKSASFKQEANDEMQNQTLDNLTENDIRELKELIEEKRNEEFNPKVDNLIGMLN